MNQIKFLEKGKLPDRSLTVGCSEIATLALLNIKWGQTPLTLYQQKKGLIPKFEGNDRTYAGHLLEPIALGRALRKLNYFNEDEMNKFLSERYSFKNKFKSLLSFTESVNPKYPYFVAHADLIELDRPFLIEGKTAGMFGTLRKDDINYGYSTEDFSAEGIPSSVYLQIQGQMYCYDLPEAYVALMSDTGLFYLYGSVKYHKKTIEKILSLVERFKWHLDNDQAPKPEIWKDIIALNPMLDKESKTVIAGSDLEKVIEMKQRAIKLKEAIKKMEAEKDDIKNAIGLLIGSNAYLESDEGESLAKAFEVNRESVSIKDLREQAPRTLANLQKKGLIKHIQYRDIRY
jgi:hypothetical protein